MDFQHGFDTVDHHMLMKKLEYYGVRGISSNFFLSYLNNRKKFVSLYDYKSSIADNVSSLKTPYWDLFFLICINDSNLPIKYFVVLVNNFKCSVKSLDKQINADLKKLASWLKASETLLNIDKTERVLWILPKN